jgi:hypothetical protein
MQPCAAYPWDEVVASVPSGYMGQHMQGLSGICLADLLA